MYVISRNEPNLRKWQETYFADHFWPLWPKSRPQKSSPWILPLLDVRNCGKLSLYAILRKTNQQNMSKWENVLGLILAHVAQIRATKFFFQKSRSVSY